MDYLVPGHPIPVVVESNARHFDPPREGAYSEGVEEYTVALRKDSKVKDSKEKISKARTSSQIAQKRFRENQKKKREEQQAILKAKIRELAEAQEKQQNAEQELQRTQAEKVQLQLRVDRLEEYYKVLQGVVKTLQKSHELLCGDTGGLRRGSNLPSSPATSPSGRDGHLSARPYPQLPAHLGKPPYRSIPMLSPISPMWENTSRALSTHPPSSLASGMKPGEKVPQLR